MRELSAEAEERVATLRAEADQLAESIKEEERVLNRWRSRKKDIDQEIVDLTTPWRVGDIVRDEKGVEYRVTNVGRYGHGPNGVAGIRLNKNGTEAYQKPRPIWSPKLELVNGAE